MAAIKPGSSLTPGAHYFWDPITRDPSTRGTVCDFSLHPVEQGFNRCAVAATARLMDYMLRGDLISSGASEFFNAELISHEDWLRNVEDFISVLISNGADKEKFKNGLNPESLLKFAIENGLPSTIGIRQSINKYHYIIKVAKFWNDDSKFEAIKSFIDLQVPVLGVMAIDLRAYNNYGNEPYILARENYDPLLRKKDCDQTHAVVILGYFYVLPETPASDLPDKLKNVKPGKYLVYQESRSDGQNNATLGNGFNIVHPRYIVEALYGECYLQNMTIRNANYLQLVSLRDDQRIQNENCVRSQEIIQAEMNTQLGLSIPEDFDSW